ncbi:chitinase [Ascochyta rabiei]|uniref:Chitinase n=1 Tax=Didymella rabiei TaxID=5454 RepID=A0A163A7U9_DIDRA|nr:chitinase [Ascochyta rabiei]
MRTAVFFVRNIGHFTPWAPGSSLNIVFALYQTPPEKFGAVSEHSDGLVFELHRGKVVQDAKECQSAFAAIISQCIEAGNVFGGESHAEEGTTYLVYSSSPDDHRSNHARAPVPAEPAKPANPAPVKPAPVKPAPVKPSPTPSKPSPTPVPAKPFKIGPTKNCRQLALPIQTPTRKGKRSDDIKEVRRQFVGSRVDIKSREELAKRAPSGDDEWDGPGAGDTAINHPGRAKKGSARGIMFDALNFPDAASMEAETAVLGSVEMYHVEHMLEWQTVAKFFEWMDRKSVAASNKFKNPDPSKAGELNFCQYFVEQWKGSYPQDLTIDGKTMKPLDHMAQAYPGVGNREEECAPTREPRMEREPFTAEKMREHITGEKTVAKGQKVEKVAPDLVDRAKLALPKPKALMGARKYMRSKTVIDIFQKQQEEMGKMLSRH